MPLDILSSNDKTNHWINPLSRVDFFLCLFSLFSYLYFELKYPNCQPENASLLFNHHQSGCLISLIAWFSTLLLAGLI
jgi:hypothetical protein